MSEQFEPRTVGIVAVASLLGGFVTVFGGGMLMLKSSPPPDEESADRIETPAPATVGPASADASAPTAAAGPDAGEEPTPPAGEEDAGAGVTANGVTLGTASVSRCFAGMAPTPIPGAQCDRLPGLDQHFQAKSAEIAACAHGHGTLSLIMDFRFSTQFVRAWGGPSSNVPAAGTVAACVRRVTAPLPLATLQHRYDRYLVVIPLQW